MNIFRIITGKAHSGKTAFIMHEIADDVRAGQGNRILIVPEQYSHEAERELCRVCGDRAPLFAEVMSFTGLARAVEAETGGAAERFLDNGGRLLCMARALNEIRQRLEVYGTSAKKAEVQALLLRAMDELKTACITPEQLMGTAGKFDDVLGDKLKDLALIAETYDAIVARAGLDPANRLTALKDRISRSGIGENYSIYVDGFTDFTAQEREVLEELLKKKAKLTICLTMDKINGNSEIFALSRSTALQLKAAAEKLGIECKEKYKGDGAAEKNSPLPFFTDQLFIYGGKYEGNMEEAAQAIHVTEAGGMTAECETAAAEAIRLVRDTGCRWRDIAVAVRGFDDYRTMLESTFRYYGVPLFSANKSGMMSKPLPALISNAYRITQTNWDVDDVTAYMRTGLTGLSRSECDTLENYIFLWQLQRTAWNGKEDWHQHPDGYGKELKEKDIARLDEINQLRRRLASPLIRFEKRSKEAGTGRAHCMALTELLKELQIPQQLEKREEELNQAGMEKAAEETSQLWDILVGAIEQCYAILDNSELTAEEFSRLFERMLSGYDIGTIPVSVDRVSAGDFDRMRRRNIRHLIVLGASDARLPGKTEEGGVFSEEERRRLSEAELELGGSENEAWREFSMIYNCLSLPSESLTMIWPGTDAEGNKQQPSFAVNRAKELFKLQINKTDSVADRLTAPGPALAAAAAASRASSEGADARFAADYFAQTMPERWGRIQMAAQLAEEKPDLSDESVTALYGSKIRVGATRVESFSSCPFSYFCKYGLKAKPHKAAEFDAMEMGIFMHYVLEKVAAEVREKGGFSSVTNDELNRMTDRYVNQYVEEKLNRFEEKSARFVYIFRRLEAETRKAVIDMAEELRVSAFEPAAFELDFGDREKVKPVEFGNGTDKVVLNGIADRVDRWICGDIMYLRVVDYKSGNKTFSFSDVYNGKSLQMLLYLYALVKQPELVEEGIKTEIRHVLPAGVMYVPLREGYENLDSMEEREAGLKKVAAKMRRSGAVLEDEEVISAWDCSDGHRYIPVDLDNARSHPQEKIASLKQLEALENHIEQYLGEIARELRRGKIDACPQTEGNRSACDQCYYGDVCGIGDNPEPRVRSIPKYSAEKVWILLGCGESAETQTDDCEKGENSNG